MFWAFHLLSHMSLLALMSFPSSSFGFSSSPLSSSLNPKFMIRGPLWLCLSNFHRKPLSSKLHSSFSLYQLAKCPFFASRCLFHPLESFSFQSVVEFYPSVPLKPFTILSSYYRFHSFLVFTSHASAWSLDLALSHGLGVLPSPSPILKSVHQKWKYPI